MAGIQDSAAAWRNAIEAATVHGPATAPAEHRVVNLAGRRLMAAEFA